MKALFVTWNGGGNLPPALAIAREVEARGGSVRFLGDRRQRATVEAAGFAFEAYSTGRSIDTHRPQPTLRALWEMVGVYADRAGAADVAASLRRDPVDVAAVDCMLLAHLRAAARTGTPTAALVHTFTDFFRGPFARGPVGVLARLRGSSPRAAWRAADLELPLTLAELDPPTASLAGRGPVPARLGPVWQAPPGRPPRPTTHEARPVVLLGLSTIWWPGQQATMQRVLDAVGELPVDVVATAGPAVDAAALRVPPNVAVHDWLDHAEVLPRASLVIGHGGHGTAMRALAHDVPVLVIPAHPMADQPMVGRRIADAGAGRVLSPRADVAQVRAAVAELAADGPHRAAAARLGARVRERDGAVSAVDALESLPVGAMR